MINQDVSAFLRVQQRRHVQRAVIDPPQETVATGYPFEWVLVRRSNSALGEISNDDANSSRPSRRCPWNGILCQRWSANGRG
ncbi:Synaptojanin-2-binding protein [Trichinella pseudospiralis]